MCRGDLVRLVRTFLRKPNKPPGSAKGEKARSAKDWRTGHPRGLISLISLLAHIYLETIFNAGKDEITTTPNSLTTGTPRNIWGIRDPAAPVVVPGGGPCQAQVRHLIGDPMCWRAQAR